MKKHEFISKTGLFLAVFTLFTLALLPLASALPTTVFNEFGSSSCDGNVCVLKSYNRPVYAQDYFGNWGDASNVFNITRNSDDLTFHYNGSKGYFNVTFEAGVIRNGGYYSMAQAKGVYPQINFNFPSSQNPSEHKYAVNITNIPSNLSNVLEFITLTYKEHYGFTLNQLTSNNGRFIAKNVMALSFSDAVNENFNVSINVPERRIYIGNLTDKISSGRLFIDPRVNPFAELTDAYVRSSATTWSGARDATSGGIWDNDNPDFYALGYNNTDTSFLVFRSFIEFNTSGITDGATITNATLQLFGDTTGGSGDNVHAVNTTLTVLDGVEDFNESNWGTSSAGMLANGDFILGGYNNITLNTTLIPINDTGMTRMGARSGFDLNDTEPTGVNYHFFNSSDETGTSSDPILEVYYTTGPVDNPPTVTLNAPTDNFFTTSTTLDFNGTPQDDSNVSNVSLYTNFSGWTANQTNNTPYNNTLTNFQVTGITEGTYLWNLQAVDNASQSAFATSNRTFTVDLTAPASFSFVSPTDSNNSFVSRNYYYVNATFTENNPDSCLLEVGGSNISMTLTADSYCELNRTSQADGEYNFRVYLNDSAGNWGGGNLRRVTLDTTIPNTIAYVAPTDANNSFVNRDYYYVNVTFTETNPDSCLLEVGGANVSMTRSGTNCFVNRTGQSDGEFNYVVYVNDSANNFNASLPRRITLDTTVPDAIAFISPTDANASTVSRDYTFINVTFTETNPSVCLLDWAGTNESTTTVTNSTGGYCFVNKTGLADATYLYQIYVNDSVDIWNVSETRYITIDAVPDGPPTITLNSPANNSWNASQTITFEYTPSDDFGFLNASVWTNETSWSSKANNASAITNGSSNFINVTFGADGAFVWNAEAYDNASQNAFASNNFTIRIDSTTPLISLVSPSPANNSYQTTNYAFINASYTEINSDSCTLSWNGVNESATNSGGTCNSNKTSLADGNYSFIIYLNDSAGNYNSTLNRTVVIDSTTPLIDFIAPTLANDSATANSWVFANVSVTELNFLNITFRIYWENNSSILNETTYTNEVFQINWSMQEMDIHHVYNVTVCDQVNQCNSTETRRIHMDSLVPTNITIIPPTYANNTNINWQNYTFLNFTFAEEHTPVCTIHFNGANQSTTVETNSTGGYCYYNTSDVVSGTYDFWAYLVDEVGNSNVSANYTHQLSYLQNNTANATVFNTTYSEDTTFQVATQAYFQANCTPTTNPENMNNGTLQALIYVENPSGGAFVDNASASYNSSRDAWVYTGASGFTLSGTYNFTAYCQGTTENWAASYMNFSVATAGGAGGGGNVQCSVLDQNKVACIIPASDSGLTVTYQVLWDNLTVATSGTAADLGDGAYGFNWTTFTDSNNTYFVKADTGNTAFVVGSFVIQATGSDGLNSTQSGQLSNLSNYWINGNGSTILEQMNAELSCYLAGHAPQLQGNIAIDPNSTLTNFLLFAFLLIGGGAFMAFGLISNKPMYTTIGSVLLMLAGIWVLTSGILNVSEHTRTYVCNYDTNATTGEQYLVNATITNTPSYENAASTDIMNGFGMILSVFGAWAFVMTARDILRKRKEEEEREQEEKDREFEEEEEAFQDEYYNK